MRLTARRLNRATLARQLLLRREPMEVAEAVRRVVALQAQEAASPQILLRRLEHGPQHELVNLDRFFVGRFVSRLFVVNV